jgi:hypothetical protein
LKTDWDQEKAKFEAMKYDDFLDIQRQKERELENL